MFGKELDNSLIALVDLDSEDVHWKQMSKQKIIKWTKAKQQHLTINMSDGADAGEQWWFQMCQKPAIGLQPTDSFTQCSQQHHEQIEIF